MAKALSLPPGPGQSRLNQLLSYARDPIGFVEECHASFGDVFTTHPLGLPHTVYFAKSDAARDLFSSSDEDVWAGEANLPIEFLIGRSSLTRLDGARHRRERKLMMPPVHGDRIVAYGAEMNRVADQIVSGLPVGGTVNIQEVMQEITIQVIMRTVFGLDGDHQLKGLLVDFLRLAFQPKVTLLSLVTGRGDYLRRLLARRYAPLAERAAQLGGPFRHLPFGELARCARKLDEALFAEIRRRRATASAGKDIMSVLMQAVDEEGRGLTDEELRDEMLTLLVAGHETTATSLSWAVALCLENPNVRSKVEAEYDRVFGASGKFDPTKVQELKYTDAVIRETMRLNPVTMGVVRSLKKTMTIGGVTLPAGVVVVACAYLAHRDPAVWPQPLRFDPERFLERKPRPGEWFPFGGGTRTCLGMAFSIYEMKVVLPHVLRRTTLSTTARIPRLAQRGLLLGPASPIRVRVEALDGGTAQRNQAPAQRENAAL